MKNKLLSFRNGIMMIFAVAVCACLAAVLCLFAPKSVKAEDDAAETPAVATADNALRSSADGSTNVLPASKTYGITANAGVPRPEHGDTVMISVAAASGADSIDFAVVFSGNSVSYYETVEVDGKPAADLATPIAGANYFSNVIDGLDAGVYEITAYVPEYQATSTDPHTHWWDGASDVDDLDCVYSELTCTYNFEVSPFNIGENVDGLFVWRFADGTSKASVVYDGTTEGIPEINATFKSVALVEGVDYIVESSTANVGDADVIFTGIGNMGGTYTAVGALTITVAQNEWLAGSAPSVLAWDHGAFVNGVNGFVATPKFLDDGQSVLFTVSYDEGGAQPVDGLYDFGVEDGLVANEIADILNGLDAGTYYLSTRVEATTNYTEIPVQIMRFNISVADNVWTVTPYIMQWRFGDYDKTNNKIEGEARYSSADNPLTFYVSTDRDGKNAVDGLEKFTATDGIVPDDIALALSKLDAGSYFLVAKVNATDNYTATSTAVMEFEIMKAYNYWEKAPSITPWVVGEYDALDNYVTAKPHFGTAAVVITDTTDDRNVVYDPANGINKLKDLTAGTYVLTATVAGTDNYTALEEYSFVFRVSVPETELIKRGLPWWGTLLIVIVVLAIVAAVFFILHKTEVLKMMRSSDIETVRGKQTDKVIAAAVLANRLEAERKAEEEARQRELEEERANAEATAVDVEEIKDGVNSLAAGQSAEQAEAAAVDQADTPEQSESETPKKKPAAKKSTAAKSSASKKKTPAKASDTAAVSEDKSEKADGEKPAAKKKTTTKKQ